MTRKRKIEHSVVRPFGKQGAAAIRAAEAKREIPVDDVDLLRSKGKGENFSAPQSKQWGKGVT